jgi:3'(2'), 5'-bisphosphate nucleotidase
MNYDLLLQIAVKAALEGGNEILKVYNSDDFNVQTKTDQSPLTQADLNANEVISNFLQHTPYPILSEEGKSIPYNERKQWTEFWLVDPLDGTKEFVKRNGEFTVNIAFVEGRKVSFGVIYVPVLQDLYFSLPGKGAFKINLDGVEDSSFEALFEKAQSLPLAKDDPTYTVVASRSHMSEETEIYIEKLKEEHGEIDFMSKGSSLKICMVAEGKANIYPRFAPTMEWDTAAGHGIAKAAGFNIFETDEHSELLYNKENLLNPFFVVR